MYILRPGRRPILPRRALRRPVLPPIGRSLEHLADFLATQIADYGRGRFRVPCRLRWRGMDRYGAASAYGWVGQPALEDRASSRGRVPLASYFVPTMHRATPGTRTLPSFSNALTFAMACARIRSRAGSSTC